MAYGMCKSCIHQWPVKVGKTTVIMCLKNTYPVFVKPTDRCNDYKQDRTL